MPRRCRRIVAVAGAALAIIGVNTQAGAAGDAQAWSKLFAQDCARCHGSSGKGDGPDLAKIHADSPPDNLSDKGINAELSDYKIRKIVTGGGPAVDKSSKMPAFGSKLSPAQIEDVIAFIRTLPK
ncbi:MAG TPA: cytochrome c [Candidatus Binataceae bacterium]|nr:cytochrome c [Candidatus Binataceae bacterium]